VHLADLQGFDTFCPVGKFIPKSAIEDPHDLRLWYKVRLAFCTTDICSLATMCADSVPLPPFLRPDAAPCRPSSARSHLLSSLFLPSQINDTTKQDDSTGLMLYRIPQLIEHVSGIMTLEEGDLILTGASPLPLRPLAPRLCGTVS